MIFSSKTLHISEKSSNFAPQIFYKGMKKVSFLMVLVFALLFSVPAKAQFIKQMQLVTPHYYPGIVYFQDGHHEEFYEIELPRTGKSALGVKKTGEEKKHTDIPAADIVGIKFWHKNFPENVHVLYYIHARKAMMQSEHQWGNPIAGSAWGVLYQCEMNYEVNKKTGDLTVVKFVGGNAPDTPTVYYIKRPNDELADLAIYNYQFAGTKKKAAELFKENQAVYEGVKSGKLKATDIQYILDEMAGGKSAELQPAIPQDKPSVSNEQNGEVGDDE